MCVSMCECGGESECVYECMYVSVWGCVCEIVTEISSLCHQGAEQKSTEWRNTFIAAVYFYLLIRNPEVYRVT